ncbi:MAG: hypothetical protein JNL98_44410, partial [Bryobacterales bacterium]|nr:hypothetical protein [Bryobacterales bacterium]
MKVRVLGCSGGIGGANLRTTSMLVDRDILIDAGTGVGDLSLAEATAAIDAAFRGWAAPATPLRVIPTADNATVRAPRLILVDRPNAPQSIILA